MFRSPTVLAMTLLITQAAKPAGPLIVAHRGASYDAPENTLAAFRLAWEQGADAVEGDFHLSKDGKIVCIHDATTKRTAGTDLKVADSTFEELRELDVGRWKGERFAGERIATLEEVLAVVPEGKKIFVEIKCGPEVVEPLKDVLNMSGLLPDQVAVISFDSRVIEDVKRLMPKVEAYWLTGYRKNPTTGEFAPNVGAVLTTLRQIGADGVDSNAHPVVDEEFVRKVREAKMGFHVWTVDDPEVAKRFRDLGVDSITTNRPAWLRERLGGGE